MVRFFGWVVVFIISFHQSRCTYRFIFFARTMLVKLFSVFIFSINLELTVRCNAQYYLLCIQRMSSRTTFAAKTSLLPVASILGASSTTSQPTKFLRRNILHKLTNE